MKTIYSTGAFGEPYRIEVSNDLLNEVIFAQEQLNTMRWECEVYLPVPIVPLNVDKHLNAEIVVRKNSVYICMEGPDGKELMLDDKDLLDIPDVYVSRDFEFSLSDHVFSLTSRDIDMIATWKALKQRKFEDSNKVY